MTSYRVGDWVYCETGPQLPYVIRKIEELTKTPCGNVEAKVICAFRRQDIPSAVLLSVENYQKEIEKKGDIEVAAAAAIETSSSSSKEEMTKKSQNDPTARHDMDYDEELVKDLNDQQRYQLKHRELYFSKYTDTIAATTIRSKCSVLLFNEQVEKLSDYLFKEDAFYYHLTYDPYQKSLVADQGEIRVGSRYQADIPALQVVAQIEMDDEKMVLRKKRKDVDVEKLIWSSHTNALVDTQIEQFLMIAKSVGTYARALDCNNAFKQPSLPLSAAFASRDITIMHALDILHESCYDIGKAVLKLVPIEGPIICKDEIEDWSAAEANLFEEAFDKIGKDFNEIRTQYLQWKSLKSIIEYYYTWKTSDRYIQQKRIKLSEQESKLKQVYIPNHAKQNQSALIKSIHVQLFQQYDTQLKQSCESCGTPNTCTNQWYAYNTSPVTQLIMTNQHNPSILANAHAQLVNSSSPYQQSRLCAECWSYWKRHHAFKYPNARQERLVQLKNQVHKCSVNGCGREFKMKQLLVKHCGTAHGYFAKTNLPQPGTINNQRPSAIRNRTSFFLLTTPMTKAARVVCPLAIRMSKLSRKPFKLVELIQLNKEWTKTTNIETTLGDYKKKTFIKRKLSKDLIAVIAKSYAKLLRRRKGQQADDDDESADDELVIDNDNNEDNTEPKPEYFKYFESKCKQPCHYIPETLLYIKPDKETMNKFYETLLQNRKRPLDLLEQKSAETTTTTNPPNVKSLRMPQKSVKPIHAIHLLNAPEEIYYVINKQIKSIRKQVQPGIIRKLSRKPVKELKNCTNLYESILKIRDECLAKFKVNEVEMKNEEEDKQPEIIIE